MTPPTPEQVRRFRDFTRRDRWDGWDPDHDVWPSHGADAVDWMEQNLVHGPGPVLGKPLRLRDDQAEWLYRWFEYDPRTGLWRYTRALKGEARGGAKTELAAALGCLEMAGPLHLTSDGSGQPDVVMAATSWEQASLLFGCAQSMLGGRDDTVPSAPLAGAFHCFDSEIIWRDNRPGRIYRVAAVAGSNEGGRPSLVLYDELHELRGAKERVHTVLTTGLTKRSPVGREVNITTAGAGRGSIPPQETDSLAWKLYATGLAQRHDRKVQPWFLFDWREADPDLDPEDDDDIVKGIRQASGAADVIWRAEDRLRRWKDSTVPRHENVRYLWNRWTAIAADTWLADRPGAWAACEDTTLSIPEGAPITVGVDAALRRDLFAVAWAWRAPDGRQVWRAKTWSAGNGGFIDHTGPLQFIVDLAAKHRVIDVAYDPRLFEVPARILEHDHALPVTEVPQSTIRRSQMDERAYELIASKLVAHDGDPTLTEHVNNAAWRLSENRRVLAKGRSGGPIDALMAAVFAAWSLDTVDGTTPTPRPEPSIAVLDWDSAMSLDELAALEEAPA